MTWGRSNDLAQPRRTTRSVVRECTPKAGTSAGATGWASWRPPDPHKFLHASAGVSYVDCSILSDGDVVCAIELTVVETKPTEAMQYLSIRANHDDAGTVGRVLRLVATVSNEDTSIGANRDI